MWKYENSDTLNDKITEIKSQLKHWHLVSINVQKVNTVAKALALLMPF